MDHNFQFNGDNSDSDEDIPSRPNGRRKRRLESTSESSDDEDPILLRRTKVRRIVQSSTSESSSGGVISETDDESNESFQFTVHRRPATIFDSDSSSSSSGSDIIPTRLLSNTRIGTTYIDDSESSSSYSADVRGSTAQASVNTSRSRPDSDHFSDSGDETADKCAICLGRISSQEVGSPEGCDHLFCLTCLQMWSANSNICPYDRQPFRLILVRENKNGQVVRQIPVQEPQPQAEPVDSIACVICRNSDREDELLLCDECNLGFHLDCLTPPLDAVPDDEWFCPTCINDRNVAGLDDEPEEIERNERRGGARPRRSQRRETIRRSSRIWTATDRGIRSRIFSGLLESLMQEAPSTSRQRVDDQPSTSRVRRSTSNLTRTSVRRKKKPKRRKYTVRKKKSFTENDDGTVTEEIVEIRERVTRRKTRRRKIRRPRTADPSANVSIPRTVRGRLARTLGMTASSTSVQRSTVATPKKSCPIPSSIGSSRASAGIPTLHIFEPRNELAPVSSESEGEAEIDSGGVGLLIRRPVNISSRFRDRSKAAELMMRRPRSRVIPHTAVASSSSVDLLGSILESQTIWHSKNTDVTIRVDGTVEIKKPDSVDVRSAGAERVKSQAPIYPSSGASHSSNIRPYDRNPSSPSSPPQHLSSPYGGGSGPRFGGPRNDREGYTNYFNSSPSGPPSICRGNPPLRFRLPPRPQLRRIPLLPRRSVWQQHEPHEDEAPHADSIEEGNQVVDEVPQDTETKTADEDIDLYSDIEDNNDKDNDEDDGPPPVFPLLGPPPAPPAFLLEVGNEDKEEEKTAVADAYDPAEPCDSEDEMVIDESHGRPVRTPSPLKISLPPTPPPPPIKSPIKEDVQATHEEEEEDDNMPIRSVYSSTSLEYSRKNEEERARDLAELQKKHLEEDQSSSQPPSSPPPAKVPQEKVGARLSFNIDNSPSQGDSSPVSAGSRSPSCDKRDDLKQDAVKPDVGVTAKGPSSPSSSRSGSASPQYPDSSIRERRNSDNYELKSPISSPVVSQDIGDETESLTRINTGLEGLDVEEVSSEMEENDFGGSASSFSLSDSSDGGRRRSPMDKRKKKKGKRRVKSKSKPDKCPSEEGEIGAEKDTQKSPEGIENLNCDENKNDKDKKKKSRDESTDRRGDKENKKSGRSSKDLSWKKPSKKDKNYREGRKSSKERAKSKEKRKSRSSSPKKDKKKGKDKKKNDKKEKKKDIERYDVRKVVKNTEVRRTDAFGRDLPSRSLSLSRSRSKSRGRARNNSRRNSRSPSKSPLRGVRRPRSPRRRFRSRSGSSPSPRRNKRKPKSPENRKKRSRSRPRRSRSRRRSVSRSPRPGRISKKTRPRRSWSRSRSLSLSPLSRGPSPPRLRRSISPGRMRRSVSPLRAHQSFSRSWSHLPSPTPREPSLEKLTVVVTAKDKKKRKKRKEDKRVKRPDEKRKKSGNSKEVFASGDNVLVSVNFNRNNKGGSTGVVVPASPSRDVVKQKKKRSGDDTDRPAKKAKNLAPVSKTIVDAALANSSGKRKKLTRLNEQDAEIILSRKPVAVIDLDVSPYREQTPSPINVVVVSDSGSGEEGKAPTPKRAHGAEGVAQGSAPTQVAAPYMVPSSGPKTPPEPPVKFSINKPQQIRQINNPLGSDGMDDEEEDASECIDQLHNDLDSCEDVPHKGPNTPPEPRGPSTPKSPCLVETPPDVYDPSHPTKSRSPSPVRVELPDIEEIPKTNSEDAPVVVLSTNALDDSFKSDELASNKDDIIVERVESSVEPITTIDITQPPVEQENVGPQATTKPPTMKKMSQMPMAAAPSALPVFSLPSPNKTSNRQPGGMVSGIQRLQHRLGSPVNKTPNSLKSTPEKRGPELLSTGNFKVRNTGKRNGEGKPRPLQDATNETVEMDDSPYSPGSSEGDDLFDPPPEPPKATKPPAVSPYKPTKAAPVKIASKFDLLFGSSGPTMSPLKNGGKKPIKGGKGVASKPSAVKGGKKASKKGVVMKMDEDQLRILDDVPSSAVELQVKDKFLKKLNRQERVVDEVKTVLKPHYARKHITKDEYKEILRKAVPKICHSKSGEINPSKIQHLVEAYVRKYRHAKKKTNNSAPKTKTKKSGIFS